MPTTRTRELLLAVAEVIRAEPGWRVVSTTGTLVRSIPKRFDEVLPPIGSSEGPSARTWLTLDFWVQSSTGGLGVFWRASAVRDLDARNRVLKPFVTDAARTGFEYRGKTGDWSDMAEPAFCGKTVSGRWWPKGGSPSLDAARAEVRRQLEMWNDRIPSMAEAIASGTDGKGATSPSRPRKVAASSDQQRMKPPTPRIATSQQEQTRAAQIGAGTTPSIPPDFRGFRCQPHYTSIFEIYPDETRIYGTEDLYGDWNSEVLLMAKDAGSSRNFLPQSKGGLGWAWVHNPARPTNRNLIPLAEQLSGGKLYASFLGPLLRNDGQESGDLIIDERIRGFVQELFIWTVANMPKLRTIAVLGQESWRELSLAVGNEKESRLWKQRHLSGQPLTVTITGSPINLVALNHPARIPASTLMKQPGWQWILEQHAPKHS